MSSNTDMTITETDTMTAMFDESFVDSDSDDDDFNEPLVLIDELEDDQEIPADQVKLIIRQAEKTVQNLRKQLISVKGSNKKKTALIQGANTEVTQQNRHILMLKEENQDKRDLIQAMKNHLQGKGPPKTLSALRFHAK